MLRAWEQRVTGQPARMGALPSWGSEPNFKGRVGTVQGKRQGVLAPGYVGLASFCTFQQAQSLLFTLDHF